MDKQTIVFRADDQTLVKLTGADKFASNIVSYIDASFDLGNNWGAFDAVRAVWVSGTNKIATVLHPDTNSCKVPAEILRHPSRVLVNLIGSTSVDGELQDRLTTYPVLAFTINKDVKLAGNETPKVTPSQFEQYVGYVRDYWEDMQDYKSDAEAWAIGKRAGTDVGPEDPTYDNNSKYYADRAREYVEDLETTILEHVDNWLDDHPEATTTVQDDSLTTAKYKDKSVTEAKLADAVSGKINTNVENVVSLTTRMGTAERDITTLDARVDQIVAPTGEAPSAAEVLDARVGEDAITYTNLGDAIRTQVGNLKSDISTLEDISVISDYSEVTKLFPTESKISEFPNIGDISSIYVPVISGASYVVKKEVNTTRFALGTTENIPAYNEPVINYARNDSASEIELTATGNSHYMLIWFRRSADSSISVEDALASLTVTQTNGAKDSFARNHIEDVDLVLNDIANVVYTPKVLIDYTNLNLGGSYSTTKRWFCSYKIPKDIKIKTISFKTNATVGSGILELWKNNNGVLEKYYSHDISSSSAGVKTVNVDVETNGETLIAFLTTSQFVGYVTNGDLNSLASTNTDASATSINYSDLTLVSGFTACISISCVVSNIMTNENVVYIGDGGDFGEIQEALLSISDDSESNPYTFIVLPKGVPYAPFSMIRNSFDAPYPWTGNTPRYISIIGIDRVHCVIQSNSGDYYRPCAEILTNGIIKNLTFIMTNDEQTATAARGGYCIHIDAQTLNDMGYDCTIEDCVFKNASNACLGIGVHGNCDLKIKRCNLETTLSADYQPHEGYENKVNNGCIFAHTSTLENSQNQRLTIEDCVGSCAEGNKSIQISSAGSYDPSTADFMYTLIRNVFWNKALNRSGYSISSNLPANPMNFGNNN